MNMAAMQNSSSWWIHLFIVVCFSLSGLALNPFYTQQVQNSSFQLSKNGNSESFEVQRLGYLVSSIPHINLMKSFFGMVHHSNATEKVSDLTLTFGTTGSIPTRNIRAKRDADHSLVMSTGKETNDSSIPVSDTTVIGTASETTESIASIAPKVIAAASETTASIEPTTETRLSSELSVAESTRMPSSVTPAASPVPITALTNPVTETTKQTYSTESTTTPFPSSVCPESCTIGNIFEINEGVIEISWTVIPQTVTSFKNACVEVISIGNDACNDYRQCSTETETLKKISGLCHFNNYSVLVWLQCDKGNWVNCTQDFRTRTAVPTEPKNLQTGTVTNSTIALKWSPPDFPNGIVNYTIYWETSDSENWDISQKTTYVIKTLKPYTKYNISVSARTSAGESKKRAGPLTIQTEQGLPTKPTNLQNQTVTSTTIALKWSPPEFPNGNITNYTIYWTSSVSESSGTSDTSQETSYTMNDLTPYTSYNISVSAWTSVGESIDKAGPLVIRTEQGIPTKPTNLQNETVTSTTIALKWSPPEFPNGNITNYTIYWTSSVSESSGTSDTSQETSYTMNDLTPYTSYNISVSAWTSVGESIDKAGPLVIRTEQGIPDPPRELRVTEVSSDAMTLEWLLPNISRGVITKYSVYWKKSDSEGNYDPKETNGTTLKLKGLMPYTNYSLNVSASTVAGEGPASEAVIQQTLEAIPSPPTEFGVEAFTDTTLSVTWQYPEIPNGIIRVYTVYWQPADGNEEMNKENTTKTTYLISNLNSFTKYNLTVSATTEAGEGPTATGKLQKTDVGVPSVPRNGTVLDVSNSSILVEWKSPEFQHGPIHGFTLCSTKYFSDDESNATVLGTCHDFRPGAEEWYDALNAVAVEELDEENVTAPLCQYRITNLDPWTNYSIEIRAYNKDQHRNVLRGPPEVILQATAAAVPVEPVLEPVEVVSSTVVSVNWRYTGHFPGPLSYAIYMEADMTEDCTKSDQRNITKGVRNSTALVTGLRPFTQYTFGVFASTPAGSSFSGRSEPVRTNPDGPERPTNVKVRCSYSPTKASVSWSSPDRKNGLIEEYKIRYRPKNSEGNYEEVVVSASEPNLCVKEHYERELQNLHPEKIYEIHVVGKTKDVSSYGESARNSEQCILPAGVPPFPKNDTLPDVKETNRQEAKLAFSEMTFSTEMGEIRYYAVIVAFSHVIGKPMNGSTGEAKKQKLPVWNDFWQQTSEIYQATPENWNPFKESGYDPLNCERDPDSEDLLYCTIGLEKNCSEEEPTYCNGPLKPGKQYGIKLRGFTAGGFSETSPIFISTASIETANPAGMIVGLIFLLLLVILIAVGVFLDRRNNYKMFNRIRNLLRKKESSAPVQNQDIGLSVACASNNEVKTQPMDFVSFLDHVKVMMSDSFLRFSLEYEEIKQNSPKHPCTAAEMEENRSKNRWMNIFPFDHSRVKLLPIDDEPSTDYINANYIPGFTSHREYIATQGPLPHTVDDFWRMVWEQGVTMIVMLTQCVERGKRKCEQYWPSDSDNVYYGDLKIQLKSESILSAYCIRIFDLQLGTKQHTVKQMHFTKWPDFGSPESPEDLINFVQAVRDHLPHTNTGPILVHCSAGVGRTGTFIAVDRLLQHIQYHDEINIYNTVVEMRQYRTNMVQTEDQYIYIHKCMRDIISQRLNPRGSIYDDDNDDLYSKINPQRTTEL